MGQLYEHLASAAKSHPEFFIGLFALSVVAFFTTLIAVPTILVKMDKDYFREDHTLKGQLARSHPLVRIFFLLGKNLLALVLLIVGVALLFLPGQGLLTLVLGILLLDFPGRHKLQKSLISRPAILKMVNQLRSRYRRPPLRF